MFVQNFFAGRWTYLHLFFKLLLCAGLNPLLVEVCIEFLQQPIAMEEEGLFRVPGDSKVVKGLHAQFMTVGSNLEQLRYVTVVKYYCIPRASKFCFEVYTCTYANTIH